MENIYTDWIALIYKMRDLHEPLRSAYACERCGRRDGLDAVVSDELWREISGRCDGGGTLCLWCMDDLASTRGVGGLVTLHFSGKALFGSSDVEMEMIDKIVPIVAECREGSKPLDSAIDDIAEIVGLEEAQSG